MNLAERNSESIQQKNRDTILWLTGWSIPDTVFDRLRLQLPDYNHVSVDYSAADSPETLLLLIDTAAEREFENAHESAGSTRASRGKVIIAGWSLGGLLALRLAAKGFADGLLLLGATARFTRSRGELDRGWADGYIRQMISGLSKDRQALETSFSRLMFTDEEWENDRGQRLPPIGSWTTPALIAGLQVLRNENYLSLLAAIDCPVLLVHGTEDKICPFGAAREMLAEIPKAKLVPILACGHAPFLEMEERIADELRRWWDEQENNSYSASI